MQWAVVCVAAVYLKNEPLFKRSAILLVLFTCGAVFVLFRNRRRYRILNRQFAAGVGLFAQTSGRVNKVEIESRNGSVTCCAQWSSFSGARICDSAAILFGNAPTPHFIIARSKFLTAEDWDDFLRILAARLQLQ